MAITRSQAVITTPPSGMRPKDISDEINNVRPAQSAITTVMVGCKKLAVDDYEFKVNHQDIDPGTVTLTNVSGTAFTVSTDDAKHLRIGQTLRLDHNTACLITAINYGTGAVTVDDGSGFTTNDVVVLGSAGSEELSGRPTPISRVPTQTTNYVETLRDAYGQSRHVQNTRYYGGNRQFHNRETCLWEHKRFIDRGLWFNVKAETTQNGQKLFKTGGILNSITTNVASFQSSQITWDKMRANITDHTRFSISPNMWLFVSRLGLQLVETIVRNKTVPVEYTEASQIKVMNVGMGNKTMKIMVIDHFEEGMEDTMVLIDPAFIEIVTTQDQKTKGRQFCIERTFDGNDATGTDGTIGEIYTDFGLRLHNEKAHAIWDGAAAVGT